MDKIVEICRNEKVQGVVANGSTKTVEVADYVAEKLGLDCTPFDVIQTIKDKSKVRILTKGVPGLSIVKNYLYNDGEAPHFLPCVVKPISGASKKGVTFVHTTEEFKTAISYSKSYYDVPILVEEYIEGKEVSVESISFRGQHYVIQITDKDSTGAPHFVELAHHQPSALSLNILDKIRDVIPQILRSVGFTTGAAHTELKITDSGDIYLIEVNPRGGGDEISTKLVYLSTGYDYMKALVQTAVGEFNPPTLPLQSKFSGIYFLSKQTENLVDFFKTAESQEWFVEGHVESYDLQECIGNNYKNGYLIYKSDKRVVPEK